VDNRAGVYAVYPVPSKEARLECKKRGVGMRPALFLAGSPQMMGNVRFDTVFGHRWRIGTLRNEGWRDVYILSGVGSRVLRRRRSGAARFGGNLSWCGGGVILTCLSQHIEDLLRGQQGVKKLDPWASSLPYSQPSSALSMPAARARRGAGGPATLNC